MFYCALAGCRYVAEESIEDFLVCALHDAPQVRAILEALQLPGAFWMEGRPITLPCGELTEAALVPRPAPATALHAADDPRLEAVNETPTRMVLPCYDLTRS